MSKEQTFNLIIQFLNTELSSSDYSEDTKESIQVARDCLQSVISGLSSSEPGVSSTGAHSLQQIVEAGVRALASPQAGPVPSSAPSDQQKRLAEQRKVEGNDAMQQQRFEDAVARYTDAIAIDHSNPIYFSNRAAAYTKLSQYAKAVIDCEAAIKLDPNYSKAYFRLGSAYESQGELAKAIEAYEHASRLEPNSENFTRALEDAKRKRDIPQGPQMGSPFGPGFGAGPRGFDFNSVMSNPAFMQMANSIMSNPQMMSSLSQLASGLGGTPGGRFPTPPGFPGMGAQGGVPNASERSEPAPQPAQQTAPTDMSSFLQLGQEIASQLQSNNPELVEQLRQQYRSQHPGTSGGTTPNQDGSSSQKP